MTLGFYYYHTGQFYRFILEHKTVVKGKPAHSFSFQLTYLLKKGNNKTKNVKKNQKNRGKASPISALMKKEKFDLKPIELSFLTKWVRLLKVVRLGIATLGSYILVNHTFVFRPFEDKPFLCFHGFIWFKLLGVLINSSRWQFIRPN